ncbi:type IV pilus biogenesis/stability protein PilW [Bowmanella sp. Y26]|uniref:type IV pilus biogenesis/stability protein PilW n=1 Tax=Bowmanella yangjiangensis TaxID=2811230 RepID=UPI001BDD706E|nr:type IV pilus biogenesis/stability protein PilW [Bowmanella yangjiangensis]MBT1062813.1 type IV pilus biogenesis/stability protein PilW [Bowmanella yangjiangensis]
MRKLFFCLLFLLTACASQTQVNGRVTDTDFNAEDAARTRISLGLTYLKNGNYTQAKFNLDKALEYAPGMADAHYSLAYYYQLVEENKHAEDAYKQAMRLDKNNPDIVNSYGAFLCQQGRYNDAKQYFQQALDNQAYIRSAETYENMALCAQNQHHLDDARQYLQAALNHQPSRGKSLLLLTEVLVQQQNWAEAKASLTKLERLGRVSPEMLLLGYKIEAGQGNLQSAQGYGNMLKELYPQHSATTQYQQLVSTPVAPQRPASKPVLAEPEPEPKVVTKDVEVSEDVDAAEDAQPQYHIVAEGENLYRISLKYNIKMKTLMEWNQMQDPSSIYVGMKLLVAQP